VIYAHAKARNDKPQITQQQWIKHDLTNNYATYKNVKHGQCLQALTKSSSEDLTLGPCQTGDSRQMWTQQFDNGTYRRLETLFSSRAAARQTGVTRLKQQLYTGLASQGWAIVGI
jgi:hypothetical protein